MQIDLVNTCFANWQSACGQIESARERWELAGSEYNEANKAEQTARAKLQVALTRCGEELAPPTVALPARPDVAEVPQDGVGTRASTNGRIPTGLAQSIVSFLDGKDWMRIAEVVAQVLPRVEADGHRTTADTLRGTVRTLRKNKILKDRDRGQDDNGQKIIEVRLA